MPAAFTDDDINRLRVALSKMVRSVDRRTNTPDISRTEITVLSTVNRLKRVPLSKLAEFEVLNPTMLSRILGKLADKGLVTREADENDRRSQHAVITPRGAAIWAEQRKIRSGVVAELLATLSDEHVESLRRALPALEALAEAGRSSLRQ